MCEIPWPSDLLNALTPARCRTLVHLYAPRSRLCGRETSSRELPLVVCRRREARSKHNRSRPLLQSRHLEDCACHLKDCVSARETSPTRGQTQRGCNAIYIYIFALRHSLPLVVERPGKPFLYAICSVPPWQRHCHCRLLSVTAQIRPPK